MNTAYDFNPQSQPWQQIPQVNRSYLKIGVNALTRSRGVSGYCPDFRQFGFRRDCRHYRHRPWGAVPGLGAGE